MNASEILAWVRAVGAELSVAGERLKVLAPPGAVTPELRAAIAGQKLELITLLQDPARLAAIDDPPLVPVARNGRLPVSLFQQRLWVRAQLLGEADSQFNMVTVWAMSVKDPDLLRRAIIDVVRRHELLRSRFSHEEMNPYAQPLEPDAVSIEIEDLRLLPAARQRRKIDDDVAAAVKQRFDLAIEPPLRWRIYIGEGGQLATLICADHIAADEWTFVLLRRELDAAVEACGAGIVRPPPELQYADYAAWERRRLLSPTIAAQLAWWEKRLVNLPEFCAPPPDQHLREPANGAFNFVWDPPFTAQLRELARAHRATLFMVLLAALAALLRAAVGRGDIVVGTSADVRNRTELESMIGGIVNVVMLRLDLEDDPSFSVLLGRARETVIDAHDHREVPFELLVERLNPVRRLDFLPFFQVSLVMHNASAEEPSKIHSGGPAQHLTWFSRETEAGLSMSFEYRSDLYRGVTIERVARQLELLLRAATVHPTRPVSELPLTTVEERAQVTDGFNGPVVPAEKTPVSTEFERQVARTPDASAVRFAGSSVTYAVLNRRANRIARYLHAHGAGPGTRVGICLRRSADLLAALLGVVKTGAAYVPIDPGFPAARRDRMIEHSGLALLVVDHPLQNGTTTAPTTIDLSADSLAIDACDDSNLAVVPGLDDPAYIIYTSGSSGTPNGVVVSHAALANCLGAMRHEPGLAPTDIVAAVTTVSFDIAGLELFLPLMVGACVLMVSRQVATDGLALKDLLAREQVTMMQATPATWRLLLEAAWPGAPGFVAWCGGEALPANLARALLPRVSALWNLYGPTETTIWSTVGRVEADQDPMTVGRPIANTRIYILNGAGQPAPVGMPGELWIGGAGVAMGYWQNPGLTAQRFLPDPLTPDFPSERMYRTGDVGRWLADGRIVHMGRLDQQFKLRGFRIEPGEIETALVAHPAIREAVVVMRGDSPELERLVAYLVYHSGMDLTTSEVREHLRSLLPDYMVPSAFVAIGGLPVTANGKIDRRKLPDPFRSGALGARHFVPPAAGAEQLIASIWADALAVERVGASDNFFDLGGHSLLGLRVAAKIHQLTGWRMPPYIMFQQTLAQIAASLDAHKSQNAARTAG